MTRRRRWGLRRPESGSSTTTPARCPQPLSQSGSRVYSLPPAASYRQGSWGAMFDEIGAYARSLGVTIELGSRVSSIGDGITIVATELESASAGR